MAREIAPVVVVDEKGCLLLQQRDDIPGIIYPGRIGLFGGHREGSETFLSCAVRELHEELSFYVPPSRFEFLARFEGAEFEKHGAVHAEYFIMRDLSVANIAVTEGSLLVVQLPDLDAIRSKLTPSACFGLDAFLNRGKAPA